MDILERMAAIAATKKARLAMGAAGVGEGLHEGQVMTNRMFPKDENGNRATTPQSFGILPQAGDGSIIGYLLRKKKEREEQEGML